MRNDAFSHGAVPKIQLEFGVYEFRIAGWVGIGPFTPFSHSARFNEPHYFEHYRATRNTLHKSPSQRGLVTELFAI